jgi:FixJ family two-component response regulator
MTGAIDDNLEAEALKAGAHAVIQKPVLPDVLIDIIQLSLKDHPGEP